MIKLKKLSHLQQEKHASLFMITISICGWLVVIRSFFNVYPPNEWYILGLLVIYLVITEYFPIPVWRGFSTINFPIIYVIYLLYGTSYAIVLFAGVVLLINLMQRRPLRIVSFNPAQYVFSFFIAVITTEFMMTNFTGLQEGTLSFGLTKYFFVLVLFYVLNNILIDLVLLIRPQKYTAKAWKQKSLTETMSAIISFVYGMLFFFLGSQNRGEIDGFTYFFFFSPLVGISMLSSVIVRLRKEKNRLKALFSITSELNKMLPTRKWLGSLKYKFREFIDVDASMFWVKGKEKWDCLYTDGLINQDATLSLTDFLQFEKMKEPVCYHDGRKVNGVAANCFSKDLKAFVYAPLVIDGETVGMFIVSRSRTKSFYEDDIQSIATLANQLAVAIKTRTLISEQEKRLILEERNRIAREIHDGVAQTLAGALMNLETIQMKVSSKPEETLKLLDDSIRKMRMILKDVRESIYALRPDPTARVGLASAIVKKIDTIENVHDLEVSFEIRGKEVGLSSLVEKVMFDTFQESLQNCMKHANATKITILLSYQMEHILLRVKDDGVGFSLFHAMIRARNKPHFGILSMNEAADKINASLQIESKEGSGTEITLTVPKMGVEGGEANDQSDVS
ncbi:GAF domain-containing sensor histidine kinase [Terrihalobacillus insolitus]|uniref:GAF domain-containing sensor histidine kinase n=1 Tax=Terrihalobacillus insolitus TaxID=2950438 RepID=UPI00234043E9|nr:GAF domain-containing sensor histidine kinase [Terrihalobacillus insolitus]MDC3413579.1 GAF domain-containing sensor histidine kinase [Terrihalobacillus insolitus]